MANEEHLARLKEGIDNWNRWREAHRDIQPTLNGAHLADADLAEANLSRAHLIEAHLIRANLAGANLADADLTEAYFTGANLTGANLTGANLTRADLTDAFLLMANLTDANLIGAQFTDADLTGAHLTRAHLAGTRLVGAHLTGAHLAETNLSGATISHTIFADVDLSTALGLKTVKHLGPSTIGIDTLYRSKGNIPEIFLQRVGVPGDMITYMKSLVGHPFEYYSCFISYSSKDQEFAERIYADLQSKAVRCWFAPEDLKIGEKFRTSIDEAIRLRDKLLLVLSTHSMSSEWVEMEVETAFEEELRRKKTILFPIRLDDSVIETRQAWAANIRRTRHIGDFQQWKAHDAYQKAFQRLLRDLKADI